MSRVKSLEKGAANAEGYSIRKTIRRIVPARLLHAYRALVKGAAADDVPLWTYDQDGLATRHNCDFMRDEAFVRAYSAGEDLNSWFGGRVHWRIHTLFWAAQRAMRLEGDLVECGVHRGGYSRAIIEFVDLGNVPDKKFYLLDTFTGLSEKLVSDEEKRHGVLSYPYENDYESVVEAFKDFSNVVIIKGEIPSTLEMVRSEKVSLLSIDLNCAEPEIAAAEFYWDRLVSGAAMILDDYGWEKHIVQKKAFDRFAEHRGVPILSLPTGQGLILKP